MYQITLSALVFILSICTVHSQVDNFAIGPRLGLNVNQISHITGSESTLGLNFGASASYEISKHSGLTVDILYSQEGYQLDDFEFTINYLHLPMLFNLLAYASDHTWRPKVFLGISPGLLLNAKDERGDATDTFKGIAVNAIGGVGAIVRIRDSMWLNTDIRTVFGIGDIREPGFQTNKTAAAQNVVFSIGLMFGISTF